MDKEPNSIITNDNRIQGLIQPISKNQLKKMKRKEEWDKKKKDFKRQKKDRQREKKKKYKEENPEEYLKQQQKKKEMYTTLSSFNPLTNTHLTRKEREDLYIAKAKEGIKIIIDCDFEALMNEKSIYSMCRQISDCYCINKRSVTPLNLILYNVDKVLYEQLHKNNCGHWRGITIQKKGDYASFEAFAQSEGVFSKESMVDYKKSMVYLTADSNNEVNQLDKQCAYIIGGIVDRNRYKMLSYNKANELGINHGRLPIGEYLKLNSSKVLTTNHVFAILSHFNDNKDWKNAFMSIIPKRKIDEKNPNKEGEVEGGEQEEEEEEEAEDNEGQDEKINKSEQ